MRELVVWFFFLWSQSLRPWQVCRCHRIKTCVRAPPNLSGVSHNAWLMMSTLCFIFFYFSTRALVWCFSLRCLHSLGVRSCMLVGVIISIGSRAPSLSGIFHYAWLMMSTLCLIFWFFTRELVWSFSLRCSHSLGFRTWHVCRCHQEAYIYVLRVSSVHLTMLDWCCPHCCG